MGWTFSTHVRNENEHKILIGKSGGRRPLERPRRGCEEHIKVHLKQGMKLWVEFIWFTLG
jgi:hypothetical protein